MNNIELEHRRLTRRYFAQVLAAGATGTAGSVMGCTSGSTKSVAYPGLGKTLKKRTYLTPQELFGTVERGNPLPYKLPPDKLAAAGLTPETWKLEVLSDPQAPVKLEEELDAKNGTAFSYDDLMEASEQHAVRFVKTLTCANGAKPLGTGLWEGVPLRHVVEKTGVWAGLRRVWYYGYHNQDPKQLFRSSLPSDRVFEDPLGTPPVILAYRLNGELLSGKRGGPVRLIVPESYGFKSIKWLSRVVLSNTFTANDTYEMFGNTTESWMKSLARFMSVPQSVSAGASIPLTGLAQVGTAGLRKVQVLIKSGTIRSPDLWDAGHWRDEPGWFDADLLAPPNSWGGRLPASHEPGNRPVAFGFSAETGAPEKWPLRFTTAHWAAVARAPTQPGKYTAVCRTVDREGRPQPWPRTIQNAGRNLLHRQVIEVL